MVWTLPRSLSVQLLLISFTLNFNLYPYRARYFWIVAMHVQWNSDLLNHHFCFLPRLKNQDSTVHEIKWIQGVEGVGGYECQRGQGVGKRVHKRLEITTYILVFDILHRRRRQYQPLKQLQKQIHPSFFFFTLLSVFFLLGTKMQEWDSFMPWNTLYSIFYYTSVTNYFICLLYSSLGKNILEMVLRYMNLHSLVLHNWTGLFLNTYMSNSKQRLQKLFYLIKFFLWLTFNPGL